MGWFKKKVIEVPSSETVELEAVETWVVRWQSKTGECSFDRKLRIELFTSEEQAYIFYSSLLAAQSLLRNSHDIGLSLEKNI